MIVVVAIALTIGSARRALAERDAVERHHRTLDVLGTLADRADAVPLVSPPGRDYRPRHGKPRPARRSRAAGVVTVAGALAMALVAGWFFLVRHRGGATAGQAPSAQATTTTPISTSTTTAAPATGGPSLLLLSSDNQQARYRVQRSSVDVELIPTAACWVEIKSAQGAGPVLFAGTLRPGIRRPVPTSPAGGGVSVRLGNPAGMSVSVDGAMLPLPRPKGTQPFTLFFQPA